MCPPKNRRKHNQHFKLLFFKINFAHQTKYLHMKNSIFLVFSSREMQNRLMESPLKTKVYYKHFYSVSKEASHTPFKAAKKSLPNVFIIDTTCFDECFLFYVITGNSIFIQIYRYPEASCNRHVAAFFEISPHFMSVFSAKYYNDANTKGSK